MFDLQWNKHTPMFSWFSSHFYLDSNLYVSFFFSRLHNLVFLEYNLCVFTLRISIFHFYQARECRQTLCSFFSTIVKESFRPSLNFPVCLFELCLVRHLSRPRNWHSICSVWKFSLTHRSSTLRYNKNKPNFLNNNALVKAQSKLSKML